MKRIAAGLALASALILNAQERAAWMPEEATSRTYADGGERIILPVTYTKLPKKTSAMSDFSGIYTIDLKNTVIDFNGATITIRPNGLTKYSIVEVVQGAENIRLTNGTIRGDRNEHDYKTIKNSHEGGAGLHMISGKEIEIDHMTFLDCTGDGVCSSSLGTRTREELLARIFFRIYPKKHLESVAFNEKGEKITPSEKTRTSQPIDMRRFENEFEIGYLAGYQGFPFVLGRVFQIYFYDKDGKFLEKQKCLQYRKISRPDNAKFLHLEFNQPEVTDKPFLVYDIVFRNNIFRDNAGGSLVVCAGSELLFERNLFESMPKHLSRVVLYGRAYNYFFMNNTIKGGTVNFGSRTGIATISGNTYENCTVKIVYDGKGVADGLYRKNKDDSVKTPPLVLKMKLSTKTDCYSATKPSCILYPIQKMSDIKMF